MADTLRHPRLAPPRFVSRAAMSMMIGVGLIFLALVPRQELWSWRLVLFGALVGLGIYVSCALLDGTVGEFLRGRKLLAGKIAAVPLYFVGGCLGLLAAMAVVRAIGLMPFQLTGRDFRIVMLVNGGIAIVVGLIFYSFGRMRDQLRQSVERLKEAEFAEKELELARDIQSRLLPPAVVEGKGYRISARNLPARFVAGDFYDVFPLGDGTLGLVVADVSGKGIGASLIMASVKAVVPLVAAGRSAAETLTELNRKLSRELAPREFVALLFARFDAGAGTLEIANAGLPDPYRLGVDGRCGTLSTAGCRFPLGAKSDAVYQSIRMTLDRGERVLFLTDGLPEAPIAADEPLGYEALSKLIVSAAAGRQDLLERLFDSVRAATKDGLEDDWTALLLERR